MAADRRLSPAELKARLQANLAVAGAKSSDPGPVKTLDEPLQNRPLEPQPVAPGSPGTQIIPRESQEPIQALLAAPGAIWSNQENETEAATHTSRPTSPPRPEAPLSDSGAGSDAPAYPPPRGTVPSRVAGLAPALIQRPALEVEALLEVAAVAVPSVPAFFPAPIPVLDAARNMALSSPTGDQADPTRFGEAKLGSSPTAQTAPSTQRATQEAPTRTAQQIPRKAGPAPAETRKRAASPAFGTAKRPANTVLHRRDQGAVLRGYRIPVDLHRQAERAKLGLASRRGSSLFWDELLQGAIDLLLDDTHKIAEELRSARRSPQSSAATTRVLQAAIRHDQDLRLRMLRIDLEELDGSTVRLEEIWTWLIRQVVKNEG